jgi:hypothetical protein
MHVQGLSLKYTGTMQDVCGGKLQFLFVSLSGDIIFLEISK